MMCACQEGHEHVVEALLKGGATVDLRMKVIHLGVVLHWKSKFQMQVQFMFTVKALVIIYHLRWNFFMLP